MLYAVRLILSSSYNSSIRSNCEKILAVKGKCWKASVRCKECPFSQTNNAKTGNGCWASYSSVLAKHYDSEDKSLIASCEEFLKLFGGENNG